MTPSSVRRFAGALVGGLLLVTASGCAGSATSSANSPAYGDISKPSARVTPQESAADALGTTLTLGALQRNWASLDVGNRDVACVEGQTVVARPFTVTCSSIDARQIGLVLVRAS